MAVPTYEELLDHCNVDDSLMEQTVSDDHLMEFATSLDPSEMLAISLGIPDAEIKGIMSQGDVGIQRIKVLKCWKQRCGSMATYKALVKALLKISRTDLAEKVVTLRQSLRDTIRSSVQSSGTSLTTPISPASSSGIEDMSPPGAMSCSSLPATPNQYRAQEVISTLRELEEQFYDLVIYTEDTLEKNKVCMSKISRRFRMLPQSVKRQHQTDENYKETRRRILDSETIKKFFDNLAELKHWNYMTPDILAHILKDVKIDEVHKKINEYKSKLMTFKANTKLRELIGISFPVPDYCMELTLEVEEWEDKTIEEVENSTINILRQATCGGQTIRLGLKEVNPGSVKLVFIFMESVKLNKAKLSELCKDNGVVSIQIDGENVSSKDQTKAAASNDEVPRSLWYSTATTRYDAGGGRDVLIIAPDLPRPHPEAVARRPGRLTEEDKLKLIRQGVPPDCQDEQDIVKARYHQLDKDCKIVEIKLGQSISQHGVKESITHLLNITQNVGVLIHYIGAGRRNTGDWCFEDGFITFRDITELYLRASHNFKGRVLTIVSDCSYSGCWVRDCMEFLDEQGVQPCGHKAREKGMIIKVYASCKSNEIPTEYRYTTSCMGNDKSTGEITFKISKQLLGTQTTNDTDSSVLSCSSETINEPCTLPPGLTWRRLKEMRKKSSQGTA